MRWRRLRVLSRLQHGSRFAGGRVDSGFSTSTVAGRALSAPWRGRALLVGEAVALFAALA
jgi:hypothetical protein